VPTVELDPRKIVVRLVAEGWRSIGGGSHDRFIHDDRPGAMVIVPRHRKDLRIGTARSIAKQAGWV
jgi:predicted RNA binding protein YcfA (HicA-like mRNA interferase family)